MFIKPYFKHNRTTNERYTVYKLCEGYRKNGAVCHRIIVSFGRLESLETVEQKKLLAQRVEQMLVNGGNTLSTSVADDEVERLALGFFNEIISKKRYDVKAGDWEVVDMHTLRHKDAREIGAEWLSYQHLL